MSKIRVAIVDDNTNMVEKMEQVIEKENDMELVFKGADGEEAIGFFEEEESDVLFLDTVLPKVDGLGVLEKIKEKKGKVPKVILLCNKGDEFLIWQAKQLGVKCSASRVSAFRLPQARAWALPTRTWRTACSSGGSRRSTGMVSALRQLTGRVSVQRKRRQSNGKRTQLRGISGKTCLSFQRRRHFR